MQAVDKKQGINKFWPNMDLIGVETGLGYPGQLDHISSRSSGSDTLYKISVSNPDSILDHMH